MKINLFKLLLCAFMALTLVGRVSHAAPTLKAGSKAPELTVAGWWQDRKMPANGSIYVVDFWASWCPPCRESMPHLMKLQQKYKDEGVVFAGVSIDEDTNAAVAYLQSLGPNLPVYFAIDDNGKSWDAWGHAAGRNSIPTTFIIGKDGNIAWIGHPMEAEEHIKEEIVK